MKVKMRLLTMRPLVRVDFTKADEPSTGTIAMVDDLTSLTSMLAEAMERSHALEMILSDSIKRLGVIKNNYESLVNLTTSLKSQCSYLKEQCNTLEEDNIRLGFECDETKRKCAEQTILINKCIYTIGERDNQIIELEEELDVLRGGDTSVSVALPAENKSECAGCKKPRSSVRLCRGELPDELSCDKAMKLWKLLQEHGYILSNYALTRKSTRQLAAYIARQFDYKLHLSCKWASFERLWGVRNLRQEAARQGKHGPLGHDIIDSIFATVD